MRYQKLLIALIVAALLITAVSCVFDAQAGICDDGPAVYTYQECMDVPTSCWPANQDLHQRSAMCDYVFCQGKFSDCSCPGEQLNPECA